MGRGARDEQAVSLRALPRLVRSPGEVGQRRYIVERISRDKKHHREPGFGRGLYEWVKVTGTSRLIVSEEIAAKGSDGQLHWLPTNQSIYQGEMDVAQDLKDARKIANHLNKHPLGAFVSKEVDADGNLAIGYGLRRMNRDAFVFGRKTTDDLTRIDYNEGVAPKSFDVTDPEEARQAKKYHKDLQARLNEEKESASNHFLDSLANSPFAGDRKIAERIIAPQNSDKAAAAKKFAEALDKGDTEKIESELQKKKAKEDAAEQKEVASRMQETISALRNS